MKNRHREDFTIRASEISPEGTTTLPAMAYLLQEVAGNNALELNFDISQLRDRNLTWILHRLHVQMDTFPEWRDTITIETWPSGGGPLRAYRDFRILNAGGTEVGRCLSYWLMLDLETRRPVRIPDEILAMAPKNIEHVLEVKKERLNPGIEETENAKTFHVRRSDLDMNRHVNNVKYIEWALAALDAPDTIREIDIEFRSECRMGDSIKSEASPIDQSVNAHRLTRTRDEQTAAVAKTFT